MYSARETAEHIAKMMRNDKTHYTRYGDGEFWVMSGHKGDRQQRFDESLQKELIEAFSIKDPNYIVSSNVGEGRDGVFRHFNNPPIVEVQKKYRDEELHNAIALAYMFVYYPKWFKDFLREFVWGKRVAFLGNVDTCSRPEIKGLFDVSEWYTFPPRQAWGQVDLDKLKLDNIEVVICAIGMTSCVVSAKLWKNHPCNFIDVGSIADAIIGHNSRSWIGQTQEKVNEAYKEFL